MDKPEENEGRLEHDNSKVLQSTEAAGAANDKAKATPPKPLRLWPGVAAAVLLCVVRFIVPIFIPGGFIIGLLGAIVFALAILVWWLFFSRAPWSDRLGAIAFMILALLATSRVVDKSISNAGMGNLFFILAIPMLCVAVAAGAVLGSRLPTGLRRASMVATILLACGAFTLIRTGGVTGDGDSDFHWRWTKTPEERLLAEAGAELQVVNSAQVAEVSANTSNPQLTARAGGDQAAAPVDAATTEVTPTTDTSKDPALSSAAAAEKKLADWPGFRGPRRDGVVRGVRIETDWSQSPPVKMWRRPIGPGWSSFAVRGDLCYTQEQRGEDEIVACYKVTTGDPVWRHRNAVRFWESNGGAGPRATPTLGGSRVYTFGATGILNALDAASGAVVWSRNVAADSDTKVPMWGFASSPLVVGDVVIVAAAGRLAAYEVSTGKPRWFGPAHGGSYSSPQRATIDGVSQILLLSAAGATSVTPADGTVLWEHEWPGGSIVQPAVMANGDVLINSIATTGGVGLRRLAVAHGPDGWKVEERWTSTGLKPYFNDFVVHKGHAFGFDGSILSCIDLADGARKWKGGRYGNGQLVLLPDQDLLLVLSEDGELALVSATPEQFKELARFPAIEGKTWNHPVLAGDVLLVRNGEEMAAYRLTLAGR